MAKDVEPEREESLPAGSKKEPAKEAGLPEETGRLLKTAEVLKRTGITHQILYRYITLGLMEPAVTTETGQRFFRPNVVDLIEIIKSLNQSGYSLRHMKEIFFKDEKVRRLAQREPTGIPRPEREGAASEE